MIKGQKHPSYPERLKELELFNLDVKEKAPGDLMHMSIPDGGVKKTEPGSSQGFSVSGQETMAINRNTGNSIKT